MKIIVSIALITLYGCTSTGIPPAEPAGRWVWTHDNLYRRANLGELTQAEINHEFTLIKNQCNIQALSIPIPAPACSTMPAKDCSGLIGFAKGFCEGFGQPKQKCDYSSVKAAKAAQLEVFDSCMTVNNWNKTWEPSQAGRAD